MKLSSTTSTALAIAFLAAFPSTSACWIDDDDFFPLAIAQDQDHGFAGVVEPQGRFGTDNDQKLVLSSSDDCQVGWRLETSGDARLFHTSGDPSMCLQAGRNVEQLEMLTAGTKMRIYPCDQSNALQRFVWGEGTCNGAIKLEGRTDLCMTWRGVVADLDKDPIILVLCDTLDKKRAAGWWPA